MKKIYSFSFSKIPFYISSIVFYSTIIMILYFTLYTAYIILFCYNESFVKYDDSLTFNNTEKWGTDELNILENISSNEEQLINKIKHSPPNSNSSKHTIREINDILEKQKHITDDRIQDMREELFLFSIIQRFNVNEEEYYILEKIITQNVNPVILKLKSKYNRVRPYILDKRIKPIISKPQHPSYPSGHSTQVHFISNILSNKYPKNKKKYQKTAEYIAVNREYAGFHYKSDTDFGKHIANVLANYYISNGNPIIY